MTLHREAHNGESVLLPSPAKSANVAATGVTSANVSRNGVSFT